MSRQSETAAAICILFIGSHVNAETLRDPTRPASARAATVNDAKASLRVEAILHSGERFVAIVDGKVVRAGDRVGAARIEAIFADGIRYTQAGRSRVARLADRTIQVRHNAAQHEDET